MKKWHIFLIVGVALLFVARIYVSKQQAENRKAQQEMINDLARQQAEERAKDTLNISVITDSLSESLDAQKARLDSIGEELKKRQKEFNKKMKKRRESR